MDSGYLDNFASIALKAMGTYSLFEANQLFCEGQHHLGQGVEWHRDQTSNEGYLHRGQNYSKEIDSKGLIGS